MTGYDLLVSSCSLLLGAGLAHAFLARTQVGRDIRDGLVGAARLAWRAITWTRERRTREHRRLLHAERAQLDADLAWWRPRINQHTAEGLVAEQLVAGMDARHREITTELAPTGPSLLPTPPEGFATPHVDWTPRPIRSQIADWPQPRTVPDPHRSQIHTAAQSLLRQEAADILQRAYTLGPFRYATTPQDAARQEHLIAQFEAAITQPDKEGK